MPYFDLRLSPGFTIYCFIASLTIAQFAAASEPTPPSEKSSSPSKPRIATRLFFQDDDARTLKWADLFIGDEITLGPVSAVPQFPLLDTERQSLVQMETAAGMVLVGVRDDDDGKFQSGWVLIDCGVDEEEHGDHSHWNYPRIPQVRASVLDDQQGNPAHLYCYDEVFYLANDRHNGFTRFNPADITTKTGAEELKKRAAFHQGGGGHITMAAANHRVAYSTWIDREGPNKGRVDVSALKAEGNTQIAYSFQLPHGGLHGATHNQGKVFFAPQAGIYWVEADPSFSVGSKQVQIHHIDLGKDGEKPRRAGAFTSFGKHVAFVTGAGSTASLSLLDASRSNIELTSVMIPLAEGNRPSGLQIVKPRRGSPLAFVFHDHAAEVDAPNRLTLIDLDPNEDGEWSDAKVQGDIEVGKSRVEGHSGHHSVAFDADRRHALFTNPGDGTISLFSLADCQVVKQFRVDGTPTKLIAVGGRSSGH